MPNARFVWCDASGLGRNVFVLFRRSFRLSGDPEKQVRQARLHLFADTRYRLWVNGDVVAYGPARFLPTHPEYDTVDLRPWLRRGVNAIVVEVNSFGENNFQAMPSVGGFIAWGTVRTVKAWVDLSTPGDWKMHPAAAWDPDASVYSFAQGPAEILDLRRLPPGLHQPAFDDRAWPAPVVVDHQYAWGKLQPRSIEMLEMNTCDPERVVTHCPLAAAEEIVGDRSSAPRPDQPGQHIRCCYGTYIYSPVEQDVTLGLFWGPHYLNGQKIERLKNPLLGNREDHPVHLRAGWNFLYGEPEVLGINQAKRIWGVLIGLPVGKGLVASARQDAQCPETVVISDGVAEETLRAACSAGIPQSMEQMPRLDVPWRRARRGALPPFPARMMAWDTPVPRQVEHPNTVRDLHIPPGKDWATVLDFGGEFHGHVVLDVASAAGTVLDVAYDERLREDGLLDLYRTNPFIDNAERYITAGGREQIEGFHPRGGRYVQVAVRNATAPVTLHAVQVRNTIYPMRPEGRFECSDPVLNWVWDTSVKTLRITLDDVWNADGWREWAMYANDTTVIYNAAATIWSDPAMMRRCLRLYARSQDADGQVPGVVPAWWTKGRNLFWVHLLHDHVANTGDLPLLRELWPNVLRMFGNPKLWPKSPRGLLDVGAGRQWFDWGVTPEMELGENGVLNAMYYGVLRMAAALAKQVNDPAAERRLLAEARQIKRAFQSLWDEKAGRYAATRIDGKLLQQPAPHANALALRYGLADGAKARGALAHVEEFLSDEKHTGPAHFELYYHFWVLEAIYDHGRTALAEHVMRRTWASMKNAGAWALWETFSHTAHQTMQLCQGWSAAPMIAMARRVLGVRPVPFKPREVLIAPNSATLSFARGAVAHPDGPIEVAWHIHGRGRNSYLDLSVRAPRRCKLRIAPEVPLSRLPLKLTLRRRCRRDGRSDKARTRGELEEAES